MDFINYSNDNSDIKKSVHPTLFQESFQHEGLIYFSIVTFDCYRKGIIAK